MNYRAAWLLIQSTWLSWMEMRSFLFIIAFSWMFPSLIYLFVWSTAASGAPIGGLSRDEFISYYLVYIVVNQITYSQTQWSVGDTILSGAFSRQLLYPLAPITHTLAAEIAGKGVFLTFVLPITLLIGLILKPELTIAPAHALLFVPALLGAWALRFLWGYWMALLSFWTERSDGLLAVQNALTFSLAGEVAPVALLPPLLHQAALLLPFRYMIGFPVEVLTGQLSAPEIGMGFAMQAGWTLVAYFLYQQIFRHGLRRYTAVGG